MNKSSSMPDGSLEPSQAGNLSREIPNAASVEDREKFFSQIADIAPCILYIYDLIERRNVWGSRLMAEVLGYSPDEIQRMAGGVLQTLIHPDDRGTYQRHVERLLNLRGTESAEFEYRLRKADGGWVWWHCRETAFKQAADGSVTQILGAALDITAMRAFEAKLIESEARFRKMADGLPLIVWVHDADGRQEFVNEAFCRFFGVTRESMRDGTWRILLHPHDADSYLRRLDEAVRGRVPFNAEVRVKNAAGEWSWIESWALPRFAADGGFLGFVGTSADITVRKEVERRLRESEQRYRSTFECAPVGIAELSLDGCVERFNAGTSEITGYSAEELQGKSWSEILHPDDAGKAWTTVGRLLSGEASTLSSERRCFRKDGSIVWVCLTTSLVRGTDSASLYVLVIIEDISARKVAELTTAKAQEQLEEYAHKLEQEVSERTVSLQTTIRELEHFSYTISHDLRAPIRAISQYSMVLLEDCAKQLDEKAKLYLERIHRAGTHMHGLTSDLLEYVDLATRQDAHLESIELLTVLDEIFERNPQYKNSADIVVTAPLIPVRGHRTLIQQALENLIENATRHTKPNHRPQVTIRTELRSDGFAEKRKTSKHRQTLFQQTSQVITEPTQRPLQEPENLSVAVRLWVEDDGPGIAPEHAERIFRLFERACGSDKAGNGAGLAHVARAVERMGGVYGVESSLNNGSRFWVELEPGECA